MYINTELRPDAELSYRLALVPHMDLPSHATKRHLTWRQDEGARDTRPQRESEPCDLVRSTRVETDRCL